MPPINSAYLEHQLKRWMRPDAHHFVRPDWRSFVRPGFEADHPFALYERKYSPNQPRVPAGSREGGQWTSDGGGNDGNSGNSSIESGRPADVQKILVIAKTIVAGGYSASYLKCLDICSPILERPQPRGVDFNKWEFHRCMSACMGK
jgi:hypothetical protein